MDRLEELIVEALSKFPSEDIRELVARETGLTVAQVTEKMNEAAIAAGNDFPAENFALLNTGKVPTEKLPLVGDENHDGKVDQTDKEIAAEKIANVTDTNKDKKISYKIGYLPYMSAYNDEKSLSDIPVSYVQLESKTAKIGTTLGEVLNGLDYVTVFGIQSDYRELAGYPAKTIVTVDFGSAETLGDIEGLGEIYDNNAFIADGAIILLESPEDNR